MVLARMEQKTARVFQKHGIAKRYEFPSDNEDEFTAKLRKARNTAKLNHVRYRDYMNSQDEELRQQRQ